MKNNLISFEITRAHWWQIYSKCRQIYKVWESAPIESDISQAEMAQLYHPFAIAQELTKEILVEFTEEYIEEEKNDTLHGLRITSVWLWAQFGIKLLSSRVFKEYLAESFPNERFTAQEYLEFFLRSSIFFLQLMREIALGKHNNIKSVVSLEVLEGFTYSQFARSLIFLLSEYCHIDATLPRALDVEATLRNALGAETFLYLRKKWYRDHLFHVVDVCLLGLFLLDCYVTSSQTFLELICEINQSDFADQSAVLDNWLLASLFHDLGYSLEVEDVLKSEAFEQYGGEGAEDHDWRRAMASKQMRFHEENLRLLEFQRAQLGAFNSPLRLVRQIEAEREAIVQLQSDLERWDAQTSSQPRLPEAHGPMPADGKKADHGERSAEYVKRVLDTCSESYVSKYKPALDAMKSHNSPNIEVSFSEAPLSFLLVLCDELQEWGRERTDSQELRETIVSQILFGDPSPIATNMLLDYLLIAMERNESGKYQLVQPQTWTFYLPYADATEEDFQPLAIWLLKTQNLQRLLLDDDAIKIRIILHNPTCTDFERIDAPDVCEFNILRNFMRDHRKWLELESWILNQDAIKWSYKREETDSGRISNEYLTIDLNKLGRLELLQNNPKELFEELFSWRRNYINGARRLL